MTSASSVAGTNTKVRFMTSTALVTAVLCILGPLSVPIGPVPISLTNLAIYFILYIVGTKRTAIAFVLYMLIGLLGVPVFSGFGAGPGKLFGPTGGYIIGFLPMAILIGLYIDHHLKNRAVDTVVTIVVMEACTWIPYLLGTFWLARCLHITFPAALAIGVTPFIIEDLAKMIAAVLIGPVLRTRLRPYTSV